MAKTSAISLTFLLYYPAMTRIRKKDDSSEVRSVTLVGLGWNVILSVGKFFAGYFGGSQALVADAIHSASDFITDIAIIIGSKFWNLC